MKRSLAFFTLLCTFLCLYQVNVGRSAAKPVAVADYSCGHIDPMDGKDYCVETSAACSVAHAYVKESGSSASPTLIVLSLHSSSGSCQYYEGSLVLPSGSRIIVGVNSCSCGSSISTHVFFM